MLPLAFTNAGDYVEVVRVGGNDEAKQHLSDLGFVPGAYVTVISAHGGDIIVNVAPGWKLINEDTQESYTSRYNIILFPVIFYGTNIKGERISTPITIDRIAPTISKSIHIRAPNACSAAPLF